MKLFASVKDLLLTRNKIAMTGLAGIVIVSVAGFAYYKYSENVQPAQEVTIMSQQEAESVQGVEKAAEAAQVPMTVGQAKEIVEKIKYIRETEQVPIYITKTTAAEAPAKIEEAKEIAKADFSIVTSKDNPEEKVDVTQLAADTPIELNQYNVQAYPKALRQIEVGRGTDGGVLLGASVHKKISDNGQYLGVGVDYDTERSRVMAKVIYTW